MALKTGIWQGYNSMTEPSTRFVKRGTISPRTSEKNHTHGHLIASLTFGFWRNLLEDGGTIHTKWPDQRRADYENDLWRKGLDKTFSNGRQYARAVEERWTRKYALDIVKNSACPA
ncbi:hypothetical protein [Bifidobacterium longum]|uniref:hypothetical protein n=1 Tax=Bifidobacterium longum TaxID=216816 RepID=UPI001F337472|nr:hypothetical protein [Bifidobacterium longum]